jgi:hypothetical protein
MPFVPTHGEDTIIYPTTNRFTFRSPTYMLVRCAGDSCMKHCVEQLGLTAG